MKKSLFFIVLITTVSVLSVCCSTEDIVQQDPIVVKKDPIVALPNIPASNLLKPAIRNIAPKLSARGITSKDLINVTKRLARTIEYINYYGEPINYKINDTLSTVEYEKLPLESKYDESEEIINKGARRDVVTDYIYNNLNQLIHVEEKRYSISYPNGLILNTYYEYDDTGKVSKITDKANSIIEYNSEGLIVKRIMGNQRVDIYTYDNNQRILTTDRWLSYDYETGQYRTTPYDTWTHNKLNYVYTDTPGNKSYDYWNTTYNKDGSIKEVVEQMLTRYDDTKAGIKNREPLYLFENEYMHEKRGKYFYDGDGYLRKYDKGETNLDMTVFFYE
jgi:hypothetical protein